MFKLFQLSILWRASISNEEIFAGVKLGPHEETIRNMILNNDPGRPYEYGCALYSSEGTKSLETIIWPPRRFRFAGLICYQFFFFGFEWIYIVSKRLTKIPRVESISEDGILEIFITPISREEFINCLKNREFTQIKQDIIEMERLNLVGLNPIIYIGVNQPNLKVIGIPRYDRLKRTIKDFQTQVGD